MHKSPSAHRAGSRTPRPAASKGARGASQHTLDVLFPSTLPVLTGPGSNAQTERSPEGLSPGRPRLRGRAHTCACVRADMCVCAWTCTPRDRGHTRVPRRVRACVRVSVCACPRLSVRCPRGRVRVSHHAMTVLQGRRLQVWQPAPLAAWETLPGPPGAGPTCERRRGALRREPRATVSASHPPPKGAESCEGPGRGTHPAPGGRRPRGVAAYGRDPSTWGGDLRPQFL